MATVRGSKIRTWSPKLAWLLGGMALGCGGQAARDAEPPPPVAFQMIDTFDDPSAKASLGVWMELGDPLPVALPAQPFDGPALHFSGPPNPDGMDVFFHVALPFEKISRAVSVEASSALPGATLTLAIGGPSPGYLESQSSSQPWAHREFALDDSWQALELDFAALGIGPDHLSDATDEHYGALHFVIPPNTAYDVWLDNVMQQPIYEP